MPQQSKSPFGSFGSFAGIPQGVTNRDELIKHKGQQEVEAFRAQADEMAKSLPAQDRITFSMFAQLGNAIGAKMDKSDPLTEEENRSVGIMENSNKRLTELSAQPGFRSMDPIEQSFARQKIIMEETLNAGDTASWASMATDLFQRKQSHQQGKAAARKLEADADVAEFDRDAAETQLPVSQAESHADLKALNNGLPVGGVAVVNGQPDMSKLVAVQQQADGTFTDEAGNVMQPGKDFLLQDDAIKIAELRAKQGAEGAVGFGDVMDLYSTKEIQNLRTGLSDVKQMEGIVGEFATVFEGAQNPESIVGNPGKINQLTSNAIKTFKQAGRTIGAFAGLNENGSGTGEFRSVNELGDELIDDDWLPESVQDDAAQASRYKAAIMQMVYADARLNEPGARQLSDADIQNAMTRLGVNSSDPATVVQVFGSAMGRRIDDKRQDYQYFENTMGFAGGNTKTNVIRALGTDPIARLDEAGETINKAFTRAGQRTRLRDDATVLTPNENLSQQDASTLTDILNR